MQPELRQFIGQSRYHKASVLRVAELLPKDDSALDELIAEIVAAANQTEFVYVVMAALSTGRPVSVRHLPRAAMLMPHWLFLGWIALHMTGELPEPLLDAVQHTQLARDMEATALYVIAAWCQKHRNGILPDGVLAAARVLARIKSAEKTGLPQMIQMTAMLRALAALTGDASLTSILLQNQAAPNPAGVKKFMAETLAQFYGEAGPGVLPDAPVNTLATGTTMRRAVARIGRNDPCPCGSGKKYKHCCHDKDQERLHHSSEVAGQTREEVAASPEQHLTGARLDKTTVAEMLRLDPRKIPNDLVVPYLMRLCGFSLFDRLAEAFEQRDYAEDLNEVWNFALFHVMRSGRRDILERMIRWRPDAAENEKQLHPGARLLLAQGDPARYLERLEELSLEALQTEDSETLEKFAYGVMVSTRLKALGIFVSRSMLPLLQQRESSFLFNQILEARDKLNLSPDDPFGDIVDKRFASHENDKESAELRKARQNLGVKAQEVRELKDSLERLQKEIVRREQKASAPVPVIPAAKPAPVDETALKEMRRKVEELKSALKERHLERNELRRELEKTQASLEEIQNKSVPVTTDENDGHDTEDSLLLPADAPESQPIRLIEFPKHFAQTLAPFPRHVARAAMIMIGRLAAGDPAAYVGALRLKATPNVMRQRIGSDYRLLFRLWPERMEVIDLINRKDLERRIKTLA